MQVKGNLNRKAAKNTKEFILKKNSKLIFFKMNSLVFFAALRFRFYMKDRHEWRSVRWAV
jgi:hypothetical protein